MKRNAEAALVDGNISIPPPSIFARHAGEAWAIEGRALRVLAHDAGGSMAEFSARAGRSSGREARAEPWSLEDWRSATSEFIIQRRPTTIDPQTGLAVLDVRGALLDDDAPAWVAMLGATTYAELRADIAALSLARSASALPGAQAHVPLRGVLVTMDSPGGMCSGCAETSAALAALAREVPVVVHAQGCLASAAYSLAAGASEIWAEPSALVGSIGAIIALLDWRGAWEDFGVTDDYITNTGGDLKASTYPPDRTPEERASLQEEIDDFYAQFRDHVLAHRNLSADTMRGQCFVASRGQTLNVVDALGARLEAFARLRQLARV